MSASSQEEQDFSLARAELRAAERHLKSLQNSLRDAQKQNPNMFQFTDPCLTVAGAEVDAAQERLRWLEEHYRRLNGNATSIEASGPSPDAVLGASTAGSPAGLSHAAPAVGPLVDTEIAAPSNNHGGNESVSHLTPYTDSPPSPTGSAYFSAESQPATPGEEDTSEGIQQNGGASEHGLGLPSQLSFPPLAQRQPPRPVFTPSPPDSPPPYSLFFPGDLMADEVHNELASQVLSQAEPLTSAQAELPSYPPGTCFSIERGRRTDLGPILSHFETYPSFLEALEHYLQARTEGRVEVIRNVHITDEVWGPADAAEGFYPPSSEQDSFF
ncbi:hypothetical protein CPB84DRAFT_1749406 [Gymnopilus junonius]|uniref:Uncharacterized protein n=1 Tax=Gymnopilus junonius TaxID=109634 RepID=A0A9P5NIQ7_GYMJU|nr:hypothetical protein CPB84DRAFT_1749406 [Gymnopilus junonius]